MKLFTKQILKKLVENGKRSLQEEHFDPKPVVKVFMPDGAGTWLLTEIYPESGVAFGLCDMGMGFPELGYVHISELQRIRGKLCLGVERDRSFKGEFPISAYAKVAWKEGKIIEDIKN